MKKRTKRKSLASSKSLPKNEEGLTKADLRKRREIIIKHLEAMSKIPKLELIYTLRDRILEARSFLVDLGGYSAGFLTLDVADSLKNALWVVYHYDNPSRELAVDFEVSISNSGLPTVLRFKKHPFPYPTKLGSNQHYEQCLCKHRGNSRKVQW